MSGDSVNDALAEEVKRLEAEEVATATRAERAADPALEAARAAQKQAAEPTSSARDTVATLAALPPEVITPILVVALDFLVRRGALYLSDEKTAERYALTDDERKLMIEVWLPAVRHYSASLAVHPLALAALGTATVYGMKALPPGGLESVLGGKAQGAAPGAVSTADLVQPAPPTPAVDPVLELARKRAAELELERAKKAGAVQ